MDENIIPRVERRKLVKSGSSIVLTVPADWMIENGLAAGDEVMMVANGELRFLKINEENVKNIRNKLNHGLIIEGKKE